MTRPFNKIFKYLKVLRSETYLFESGRSRFERLLHFETYA